MPIAARWPKRASRSTKRNGRKPIKIVDERLARRPDEASSLYNLGRLSAVSGQHLPRGEETLRRFLAMTGSDPARLSNAHYRLGMIKEKAGDMKGAATEYRAAIDFYPRHQPAADALKKFQSH